MIFDTLDNAERYTPLHPHFAAAFAWIQANAGAAPGKYSIAGDECFVMVQIMTGQENPPVVIEAHKRYIDIQVGLQGEGRIGWKSIATCEDVRAPYDTTKDAALWNDEPDWYFTLGPGQFAILYPEDGHAPLPASEDLLKIVVKVLI